MHEMAEMIGLAIYQTVRLAAGPHQKLGNGPRNRRYVEGLWVAVSDKMIEFAESDD